MNRIDFTQFKYLVIDSSFFVSSLDEALCAELGKYCDPGKRPFLCSATTFHSEVRQYMRLLEGCPEQLEIYQNNLEQLRENKVRLFIHNYRAYRNRDGMPRYDTWTLILYLLQEKPDAKILLLTGNELLLRRIVLNHLPVSIYDFKQRALLSPEELAGKREKYELDMDPTDPIELEYGKNFQKGEKLTLYDSPDPAMRQPIELTYDLHAADGSVSNAFKGTEADFFSVKDRPNLVAKVYGKDNAATFSDRIARNIEDMEHFHGSGRFPWALLPESLLYDGNGSLAGYLMRKLDKQFCCLQDLSIFKDSAKEEAYRDVPYSRTLEICMAILREIAYMSNYDILPVDLSKGNFCISESDLYVYLLDTCSFCFDRFFSDKRDPDLEPQYFDLSNPVESKLDLIDVFLEYVHLFIMSLMTRGSAMGLLDQEGDLPITSFCFPGSSVQRDFDTLVPENLRQLYWSLYSMPGEEAPVPFSIEVLMEEMEYALTLVKATDPTYGTLMDDGGHQGDEYPPRPDDILPCIYQDDEQFDGEEPVQKPEPVERPKYLQPKTPPQIHTFHKYQDEEDRRANIGHVDPDPLPPVPGAASRFGRDLFRWLAVLTVIAVLVGIDMLCYSGAELGLSLAGYWTARMDMLRKSWGDIGVGIAAWFGSAVSFFTGAFR